MPDINRTTTTALATIRPEGQIRVHVTRDTRFPARVGVATAMEQAAEVAGRMALETAGGAR